MLALASATSLSNASLAAIFCGSLSAKLAVRRLSRTARMYWPARPPVATCNSVRCVLLRYPPDAIRLVMSCMDLPMPAVADRMSLAADRSASVRYALSS